MIDGRHRAGHVGLAVPEPHPAQSPQHAALGRAAGGGTHGVPVLVRRRGVAVPRPGHDQPAVRVRSGLVWPSAVRGLLMRNCSCTGAHPRRRPPVSICASVSFVDYMELFCFFGSASPNPVSAVPAVPAPLDFEPSLHLDSKCVPRFCTLPSQVRVPRRRCWPRAVARQRPSTAGGGGGSAAVHGGATGRSGRRVGSAGASRMKRNFFE